METKQYKMIIKSESDLIQKYNAISEKHKGKSLLPDLTDIELFIWITGKTYQFGRSLKDSIDNACIQMEDRDKTEKRFGFKKYDIING